VDIVWPIASIVRGVDTIYKADEIPDKPHKIISFKIAKASVWPIVFIGECSDRLLTIDTSRLLGYHSWQVLSPDVVPPFKIKIDRQAFEISQGFVNRCSFISILIMLSYEMFI
jgi:hypothetical protein